MKLDRSINQNRRGKYALVKLRNYPPSIRAIERARVDDAICVLQDFGMLDFGDAGTESEFFVIRLKDKYARGALDEYADDATRDGEAEFGQEVRAMAMRSGAASSWCKKPD